MNRKNIHRYLLLLLAIILLPVSCMKENDIRTEGDGEKEVEMIFETPGGFLRTAIEEEDALKDITLLVFNGNESSSKFLYCRHAWKTSSVNNSFRTTLRIDNNITIYFAANVKEFIKGLENTGKLVEETTQWSEAKEWLTLDKPTDFALTEKGLPMWGHKFDVSIANVPVNNLGTVKLLRAVASVDIAVTAANFSLEKAHIVFAANKGYLAYDPTLLSDDRITKPQSPIGMTTTIAWNKAVATDDNGIINNYFYMYENATPLTPEGENRPTKVILEGVWNGTGGSGETTFYPLSFRNGDEKQQVTRNNKYLITVTGVNGDGFRNLPEAKDADDVNMEYNVIAWDTNDGGRIEIDGSRYFYIESADVVLGYKASSADLPTVAEIIFDTNYSLNEIKMAFSADGEGVNETVSNNRFKAEVVTVDPDNSASSGDEYTCFRFTALKDYALDKDNPSTLYVTCGRLSFRISVSQIDRSPGLWEDGGETIWNF